MGNSQGGGTTQARVPGQGLLAPLRPSRTRTLPTRLIQRLWKFLGRTSHLRAPSGDIRKRDRLFILFDDGTRWCNEDVVQSGPHLKRDEEIIQFVSRKSGRPVEELEFIEDAQ